MRCLSCQRAVTSQMATMWQNRVLLCKGCGELADKATAELAAAAARASAQALMFLEQHILRGGLLTCGPGLKPAGPTAATALEHGLLGHAADPEPRS